MTHPISLANSDPPSLSADLLQKVAVPDLVIHVGVGNGIGDMNVWQQWDVRSAIVIDADQERLEWIFPLVANHSGWRTVGAVLSDQEGERDFYRASNPAEDGLMSPAHFDSYWPNLRPTGRERRPVRRLDALLTQTQGIDFRSTASVWMLVDCFPALPIIKGAGRLLDRCSVVWVRVLLEVRKEAHGDVSLDAVTSFLESRCFRCVDVRESNHPAVGYAVFSRAWQTVLDERDALGERCSSLGGEVAKLSVFASEQSRLAADRLASMEALTHEGRAYREQCLALEKEVARLNASVQEQSSVMAALAKEREDYARQIEERKAEAEELAAARATLADEKVALVGQCSSLGGEVAKLSVFASEQSKFAADRLASMEALTLEGQAYREQCLALEREVAKLNASVQEQSSAMAALAKEREDYARQIEERKAEVEELAAERATLIDEKAALAGQCSSLGGEVAKLSVFASEQSKLAADRLASMEALTLDGQAYREQCLAFEREVAKLNASVQEQNSTVAAIVKEREDYARQTEQQRAELETLLDVKGRQQQISEEILCAAAQIDLIKDILSRTDMLSGAVIEHKEWVAFPAKNASGKRAPHGGPGKRKTVKHRLR